MGEIMVISRRDRSKGEKYGGMDVDRHGIDS
jgi:hypothetical protein